ncbi:MAG: YegS/Rv2252/BmrU family lipid kinase [Anaerolineae bacterium]|nr:YegS/Rv2252/BmrU family lipid kinase [Anaerolineae bacterium]
MSNIAAPSNMPEVMIIVNPFAHSGGAAHRTHDLVTRRLEAALSVSSIVWCNTDHPGHGIELAREAAEQGIRYVFAAGGDGTISEVVNGLMTATVAQRPILGVLPWGTLNDFFMALVDADANLTADGLTQPLDIGRVQADGITRYCCLSISAGLNSWAHTQYQQASKRFGRLLALLPAVVMTLFTYRRTSRITLHLDDQPVQQRRMLALAIGNSASVGGGVRLTPDAQIDDSWFDVSVIKEVSMPALAWVMIVARLRRKFRLSALDMYRARYIEIDSKRPISVHIDGEMLPLPESQVRHLSVEVLSAALNVVRPSVYLDDLPVRVGKP